MASRGIAEKDDAEAVVRARRQREHRERVVALPVASASTGRLRSRSCG